MTLWEIRVVCEVWKGGRREGGRRERGGGGEFERVCGE